MQNVDNINYLLKLNSQERHQLLSSLGFEYFSGFRKGNSVSFSNNELFASSWDHNFEKVDDFCDIRMRLNDFKLLSGFNDPNKDLQRLYYSFMVKKFGEKYKKDCKNYLEKSNLQKQDLDDTLNCLE